MGSLYNPLDKIHLGESIRDALLRQPLHPLPPAEKFSGAGIYAIYYVGGFPTYRPIAQKNREGAFQAPVYVGEAVPEGSRTGRSELEQRTTYKLYERLRQHAGSIDQAENLELADFYCRYLVVDDIWIPLGEALMIATFAPVWNKIVPGFGIHDTGSRRTQNTSAWDALHPGRRFVRKRGLPPNPKSPDQLIQEVEKYLALPPEARSGLPTQDTGK